MRYCDLTLAYNATSGGIRTYIDAKRQYLKDHGDDGHLLVIPGERDHVEVEQGGRLVTCTVAGPVIPGCAPYRCFWRPGKLVAVLERFAPDVVEQGSFLVSPKAAFRYRRRRSQAGRRCLVSAYFHTDIADAYFGATLRRLLGQPLAAISPGLARVGDALAAQVERGARRYFGGIFQQCDLVLAASPAQCGRLRKYGVDDAQVVPLGVDLALFHPKRRSRQLRERWFQADERTVVVLYAGRFDEEKRVDVLVEAFGRCRLPNARLVLTGEGALREALAAKAAANPNLLLVPYQNDKALFAQLLASADIYATAGPHETFGLSVVEAQASGLPVVGVQAGALPERVAPGTGLLGPVNDAEALARNLEQVAAQRERLSVGARRHVERSCHGWDATFSTLFQIYQTRWQQVDGGR